MSDFFNKYPYTDFHELNLDWVIDRVKKLTEDWIQTSEAWEGVQQDWADTEQAWIDFKAYVENYLDNLDVQDEIDHKIDEMVSDGTLRSLMAPDVTTQAITTTTEWLADNITQPTTPAIDASLSIEGAAADSLSAGNAFRNLQNGSLQGLNSIEPIHTSFIDSVFQFCDNDQIVEGYVWAQDSGGNLFHSAAVQFGLLPAFYLPKGDYTCALTGLLSGQSFLEDIDGIEKFSTRYSVTGTYVGDFTLLKDTKLYLTTSMSNHWILIVNKNNHGLTYSSSYKKRGYYDAKLIDIQGDLGSDVVTDQYVIRNKELTCYNNFQNANTSVAKYARVDMGSDVNKIKCRAKFKNLTTDGTVTLISTKLNTSYTVQNITQKSLHIGFSGAQCSVELFDNNVKTTLATYNYTISTDTIYEFGWSYNSEVLTVYLPDGTTQTINNDLSSYIGRYMIFETFKYLVSEAVPTLEFSQPRITGIYCTCASGLPLRDNFNREDGSIFTAPTGHIYFCFRNYSAGDTVFDSGAGTIN